MGSKGNASKKRGSLRPDISTPMNSTQYTHDNSIDEMANMLLDDTTVSSKKIPLLPQLRFNRDDAWAQKIAPVVTAAGKVNQTQFSGSELSENPTSQFFSEIEESTPPIPRRSSKRKSALPTISNAEPTVKDWDGTVESQQVSTNSTTPPTIGTQANASPLDATFINGKIEAMLAATSNLKGKSTGNVLPGPFVAVKKRRLKDNKVIVKVRTAITHRLSTRSVRNRHDSAGDDHLLDHSLNELQDDDDLSHSVSNMDIRLNEGDNFRNPKVSCLTGHGHVSRKPVADDGRSIRSKKSSSTDPFSERPGSSGVTRTPTNFELSLQDDMSIDPGAEVIPDLPSRPQSSRESLLRGKKLKGSLLAYDSESLSFDALLSSSPLAQSTPRLRLEPTLEEDGRRTLRNVRANSRSVFGLDASSIDPSEMETDPILARNDIDKPSGDRVKRKSSQIKEGGLFKLHSKRTKKHPSPSKEELEGLKNALLEAHPAFGTSESLVVTGSSEAQQNLVNVGSLFTAPQLLAPKDPNAKVKVEVKAIEKRMGMGLFSKPELSRSGASIPDMSRRLNGQKSMIPRPAEPTSIRPRDNRFSLRDDAESNTAMDIDELQWDKSAYEIGMKKKA